MLLKKIVYAVLICVNLSSIFASNIINGSFEEGLKSWKIKWIKRTAAGGRFCVEKNKSQDGSKSFHVVASYPGGRLQLKQTIEAVADKTYRISFDFLTGNNQRANSSFRIEALDKKGKHLGYFCLKPLLSTGNEWNKYNCEFRTPANTTHIVPEFNFITPEKCWLDNLKIQETKSQKVVDWKQFAKLNHQIGQGLDRNFREAGERIDIAIEDLNELKAQGHTIPSGLFEKAKKYSKEVFDHWLKLENQRIKFYDASKFIVTPGNHILKIENISPTVAANTMAIPENIWCGIRNIKLRFPGKKELKFTPNNFRGGKLISNYRYKCKPANAMFIYSQDKNTIMLVDIPSEFIPEKQQKAFIVVSGLDYDKELNSKIRITLNDCVIFDGKNDRLFSKNGWTDAEFKIPVQAFKNIKNLNSADKLLETGYKLLAESKNYKKWAMALASEIDTATLPLRKKMVYRKVPGPEKSRFLRGICFHGYNGWTENRSDKTELPYNMFDYEYQAKAMRGIGANLIYSDVYNYSSRQKALSAFDRVGLPIAQVGRRNFSRNARDIRYSYYYNNPDHLFKDLDKWLKRWQTPYKMFWALGIDEPVIANDFGSPSLSLPNDKKIQKEFKDYLLDKKAELTKNNIAIPEDIDLKLIQKGKYGKAIWMELQKFMSNFLAKHLAALNTYCKNLGFRTIPMIMSHNHFFPQECSYVTLGEKLPLLSTDLYHNGELYEAFNFQLFRNAVDGTAWMTPGAGYSCKTADRFRRSLAISMIYADGVLQWTNLYCSKYRGPFYFWRGDGTDGQGDKVQGYWHWSFWTEMEDMYRRMKESDQWLSIRESTNKVILLFSDRQAILNTFQLPRKYFASKYFDENLGLYADLIRSGISVDVGYIETAARKGMSSKYKVAILSNAECLTSKEVDVLRKWVRNGGTLIVSANTGTLDKWGRQLGRYSLSDVYGIEKSLGCTSVRTLKVSADKPVIKTALVNLKLANNKPAKVLRTDAKGTPILLSNDFGKGRVIFFAMENIGNVTTFFKTFGDVLPSKTGVSDLICPIVKEWQGQSPITIKGIPKGVEVQVRKKGDSFVVHLLDWHDNRLIKGNLIVNQPGTWQVFYPNQERLAKTLTPGEKYELRDFRIHDMIVVTPKTKITN
jgi:hypothetical protein